MIIAAVCQEWTRELLVKLKKGSKMIVPQKTVVYKGFMLNWKTSRGVSRVVKENKDEGEDEEKGSVLKPCEHVKH